MRRPRFKTNTEFSGLDHGFLPYTSQGSLLTDGELRFYRDGLYPAMSKRYKIMTKCRLTDVICVPEDLWRTKIGHQVQARHVDFVLVRKSTLRIVCVLELDDKSHSKKAQLKRDAFLDDALLAAGIPLIRLPIRRSYDPVIIRRMILNVLRTHPLNQCKRKPKEKKDFSSLMCFWKSSKPKSA